MFDRLIHFSIHNKLIIGLLTLALVAWGGYSLSRLPIDAVPDITSNQVVVYTVAPSLAAQEIERLVSFPVEQSHGHHSRPRRSALLFALRPLGGHHRVRGQDRHLLGPPAGIASGCKEAESQIPAGTGRPELAPVSTGLGEIYQYLVRAKPGFEKKYNATELRTIQDWIVRRQLLGTPGVADVSSFGGLLKQYEVALDPERLRSLGVTVERGVPGRGRQQPERRRGLPRPEPHGLLHPHRRPGHNARPTSATSSSAAPAPACPCWCATWPTCASARPCATGP